MAYSGSRGNMSWVDPGFDDEDAEPSFRPTITQRAASTPRANLVDRLDVIQEDKNRHLQTLIQKVEAAHAKDLTFQPQTNEYAFRTPRYRDPIKNMERDMERRTEHRKQMRERADQEEKITFKPEISEYSKRLMREEPAHERLYSLSKEKVVKDVIRHINAQTDPETGQPYFQPMVNHIPTIRDEKVENSLYKDAENRRLRRQMLLESIDYEDQVTRSSRKMTDKSAKLAIKRLRKQLKEAFKEADVENSGSLGFVELGRALQYMGIFRASGDTPGERRSEDEIRLHEQLWNVLDVEHSNMVDEDMFVKHMLVILDPVSTLALAESEALQSESMKSDDSNPRQLSVARQGQLAQLAAAFKQLKVNHLAYGGGSVKRPGSGAASLYNPPRSPPKDPQHQECTFRPTLNPQSEMMESQFDGRPELRFERLYHKSRQIQDKLEEQRSKKKDDEMKECTFKPQINRGSAVMKTVSRKRDYLSNDERLDHLHRTSQNARAATDSRTTEDKEFEEHCTFKPDLSLGRMSRRRSQGSSVTPRGYEQAIERMRAVNAEKEAKKQEEKDELDRRYARAYTEKYKDKKLTKPKPFSFETHNRKHKKPLMYMDVNLGPGKTGRIGIHEGDDPRKLAEGFAASYRLDDILTDRLEELLKLHMDELHNQSSEMDGGSGRRDSLQNRYSSDAKDFEDHLEREYRRGYEDEVRAYNDEPGPPYSDDGLDPSSAGGGDAIDWQRDVVSFDDFVAHQ